MALWMTVSLAERAVPAHCPEHDALPAAMMSHADAHAGHGGMDAGEHAKGGAHHCTCLEQCDCTALPLASSSPRDVVPPAVRIARAPVVAPERAAAHPDTRLPFATAPPLASRA
jgi:hypothetical protein